MDVHDRIKKIREDKRLSQNQVADGLGIAYQNYWKIEKGKTELTVTRLLQLAKILEVDVLDLLSDDGSFSRQDDKSKALETRIKELEEISSGYKTLYDDYFGKLQLLYVNIVIPIQRSIINEALIKNYLTEDRYEGWLVEVKQTDDGDYFFNYDVTSIEKKGINVEDFFLSKFLSDNEIYSCLVEQHQSILDEIYLLISSGLRVDKGLERAFWKFQKERNAP